MVMDFIAHRKRKHRTIASLACLKAVKVSVRLDVSVSAISIVYVHQKKLMSVGNV